MKKNPGRSRDAAPRSKPLRARTQWWSWGVVTTPTPTTAAPTAAAPRLTSASSRFEWGRVSQPTTTVASPAPLPMSAKTPRSRLAGARATASALASQSMASIAPDGSTILTPLSLTGLWLAVTMTPTAAPPRSRDR